MLRIPSPAGPHNTNVHEANKHFIKAILDADRLFIPKENRKQLKSHSLTHAYPQAYPSL